MMIDSGPKFYSSVTPAHAHAHGLKVKVKNLEILYWSVLRAHIFQTIW